MLVACLCAGWCRTCTEYRATFDALAAEFPGTTRFVWVDIEDEAAVLGEIDVVDFPTLLLAQGDQVRFYGPVTPHARTARQLVDRALDDTLGAVDEQALEAMAVRLAALT